MRVTATSEISSSFPVPRASRKSSPAFANFLDNEPVCRIE